MCRTVNLVLHKVVPDAPSGLFKLCINSFIHHLFTLPSLFIVKIPSMHKRNLRTSFLEELKCQQLREPKGEEACS